MIIDRATPATQNEHDKSIRYRPSHDSNLQQAQTFFLLKYKKCKGTAKNTVKRKIKYDDYNKVLETNEVIHRSFNSIRSKNHKIYSINTTKVSLNSYEKKRYWTTSVHSLAYGHYEINGFKSD